MATTDLFCPRCEVLNSRERPYCRECGANLHAPGAASAPWATPRPPAVRVCPRCRKRNLESAAACSDCGGRLMSTGRWPEPVVPARPRFAPLPCPGCGTLMEAGVAFLDQGTVWEQVLGNGNGWRPLVFRRDEAERREKVVRPGEKTHAQRCPGCNAVWIGPPPPR